MSQSWWKEAQPFINLGDQRLNKRMVMMVDDMSQNVGMRFSEATNSAAAAQAAYRFVENPRIKPESISASMIEATRERVRQKVLHGLKILLVPNDTTWINFPRPQDIEGLGPTGSNGEQGMLLHSAVAITPEGVPLGLLSEQVWSRPRKLKTKKTRHPETKLRLEDKESFKWLKAAEDVLAGKPPEIETVVMIGDQESDLYDLFARMKGRGVELLVRAAASRRYDVEKRTLQEAMALQPVAGKTDIALNRAPGRRARTAHCEVRFAEVTLKPPRRHFPEEQYEPIKMTAIGIREIDSPSVVTGLSWLLLTTLPVTNVSESLKCIRYYTMRWVIERYHLTLKSGCRIEEWRLESKNNLHRLLGVLSHVAWRLLWILYQSRVSPQSSCEVAFTRTEWVVLFVRVKKQKWTGSKPPTMQEAVRWLASLGGFWGRKGDGDPGVIVLWRGMRHLQESLEMAAALSEVEKCG